VTLQLNGVTPQQFLGHQAQYNHIIAEARPAAREPLHAGCEPAGLACLPVVVLHGPSDSTVRVSTDGVAEKKHRGHKLASGHAKCVSLHWFIKA